MISEKESYEELAKALGRFDVEGELPGNAGPEALLSDMEFGTVKGIYQPFSEEQASW